jgi:hypothetical protein
MTGAASARNGMRLAAVQKPMDFFRTAVAAAALAALPVFPSVTGHDLNGRTLQLPKDLAGDVDLLFIAFVRGQQADVDTWKNFADAAQKNHPNLKVYEVPVLARGISLMRGFIDGGMRNAIKTDAARAATVTLYIDKEQFRHALDIPSEDRITVLLIKRDGTVLWKATGPYDAAKPPDIDALLK